MTRPEFQAVILAGGYGHRLSVLVDGCPKALLPIANRPMIAYLVDWLESAGITEIFVLTNLSAAQKLNNYLSKVYESHYTDVRVEIITVDNMDYGTADVLRHVRDKITTDFLVLSCDLQTDLPLSIMLDQFRLNRPSMLCLFGERVSFEHTPAGGGRVADEESRLFVGMDRRNQRLVYLRSEDDLSDEELVVSMRILNELGSINMFTQLFDCHAYLFSRWVVDLLAQRKDISSIREDLVPLLVRCQFSDRQLVKEGLAKVLQSQIASLGQFRFDLDDPMEEMMLSSPSVELGMMKSSSESNGATAFTRSDSVTYDAAKELKCSGPDLELIRKFIPLRCQSVVYPFTSPAASQSLQRISAQQQQQQLLPHPQTPYCIRANSVSAFVEMNRIVTRLLNTAENRIAASVEINPRSQIGPDSAVGEGTKISEKSSVKKSQIGAHCSIGKNVRIANSVLLDYVIIEDNVKLENCIVCSNAVIKEKSSLKDCEVAHKFTVPAGSSGKGEHFMDVRVLSADESDDGYD